MEMVKRTAIRISMEWERIEGESGDMAQRMQDSDAGEDEKVRLLEAIIREELDRPPF